MRWVTARVRFRVRSRAVLSLAFNPKSTMLCVSSDRRTVHIFHVEDMRENHTSVYVA